MSTTVGARHQGGKRSITQHREGKHPLCTLPGSGYDGPLHAGGLQAGLQELGHVRQHLLLSAGSALQCWAARRSNLEDDAQPY